MKLSIVLFSALIIFSSCGDDPVVTPPVSIGGCESDAIEVSNKAEQADAIKEFGVNIFQEAINSEKDENIILSPLSIYSAILLAYKGSACETKKQMMRTLTIGESNQNVDASTEYLDFMNGLLPSEGDVTFTYANALFSDPTRIELNDQYVSDLEQFHGAEAKTLDFAESSALDAINNWADENTNGKIKKVLEEISGDEIAFLLNAIYYSGDWQNGFVEQATQDRPFYLKDGSEIQVPTMLRDAGSSFFIDDNFQIADMDIKGGEYAVSFLSTSNLDHVDELLLSDDFLANYQLLLTKLQTGRVYLSLPKFELSGKKQLKGLLAMMGMTDAFSTGSADFSGMGTAGGNIFLTRVLHDTYIKVDEKGIEGAAVTTVGVGTTSVPPPMDFNKAFAFVLRHKETGVPIFIGKVENPLE